MKLARRLGCGVALAAAAACGGSVDRTGARPTSAGAGGGGEGPGGDGDGSFTGASGRSAGDASVGAASGPGDVGAADAASSAADATSGGAFAWDGSVSALLEACPPGRDAFYVADHSGPDFSTLPFGPFRATNLDHAWTAGAQPLSFSAQIEANSTLGGGSVAVTTTPAIPLVPGTYPEPLNHSVPRPYLDVTVGDIILTADGYTGGSFVIADLAADGDAGVLSAVHLAFDITVPGPQGMSEFVGCLRYAADAPADAGSTFILDDASGPDLLVPCSVAPSLYLEGHGFPGLDGALLLTGGSASFSSSNQFSMLEVDVESNDTEWQISAGNGGTNGVPTGQFVSGAGGASVQIKPPTGGCIEGPIGPFAISQLAMSSTSYDPIAQAAMWFDLQCPVQGGTLRGCVAYGP